jgi:hypothetical protein
MVLSEDNIPTVSARAKSMKSKNYAPLLLDNESGKIDKTFWGFDLDCCLTLPLWFRLIFAKHVPTGALWQCHDRIKRYTTTDSLDLGRRRDSYYYFVSSLNRFSWYKKIGGNLFDGPCQVAYSV